MQILIREPNATARAELSRKLRKEDIDCAAIDGEDLDCLGWPGGSPWGDAALVIGDHSGAEHEVRRVRATGFRGAVVAIIAERSVVRTTCLLGAGCDDVLEAPVDIRELSSRLAAIERRLHGHAAGSIEIGAITVHFDGRDPEVDGEPIRLSGRESAIFHHLARHGGRVVPRSSIYDAVYGVSDSKPFDKVIDVFICKLRKKIKGATGRQYIRTVHGMGYILEDPDPPSRGRCQTPNR